MWFGVTSTLARSGSVLRPARGGGALQAQRRVGRNLQATARDRLGTRVAEAVGALVDLGQRAVDLRERNLERAPDTGFRYAADRLARAVADPLAEAEQFTALGRLGELSDALLEFALVFVQKRSDNGEVDVVGHAQRLARAAPQVALARPGRAILAPVFRPDYSEGGRSLLANTQKS